MNTTETAAVIRPKGSKAGERMERYEPEAQRIPSMARVMERNIEALLARREKEEKCQRTQDRVAARISCFAGSMAFVYIHLLLFGGWVIINLGGTPFPKFDPTFVVLAMFASVEAIFLSTFVLITQNRMQAQADRRADLELQVNLLAEHEVTRMLQLVSAIAERMGIDTEGDHELNELKRDVRPEQVLDKIEETQEAFKAKDDAVPQRP